ncbi:hypothetical protein EVAR_20394_1 [Eumeta japonica]|uniref:CUB domain-containing protein n=1 Tax=Eumeta variegata TaxID=151549 RepID=A0A4C1TYC7_EUMVA|nr:hypothetical protein EVAR_20394_1 [Eumeta japonica]
MVYLIAEIDIHKSEECRSEWVEVRDGYMPDAPVLGRICGSGKGPMMRYSGSRLTVIYQPGPKTKPHKGSDRAAADTASDERPRPPATILLGTALVDAIDNYGNIHTLRVLVDSASQKDLITAACCKTLKLQLHPPCTKFVAGVGHIASPVEGVTCLTLRSRYDDSIQFPIRPLVVDHITKELPTAYIDVSRLNYLNNLPLSDCQFYKPAKIYLIIGSDLFARILRPNIISCSPGQPVAIDTLLGYVILGEAPTILKPAISEIHTFCTYDYDSLSNCLNRFFELEDVPDASLLTFDESECETIYCKTTRRDESGRYSVALPFKGDVSALETRRAPRSRYYSLERKLLSLPRHPHRPPTRGGRALALPDAAAVAERDLYMDDLVSSCLTEQDAALLSNELIELFRAGRFDLIKFSRNSAQVMSSIPHTHRVSDNVEFDANDKVKILGLHWLPAKDVFTFSVDWETRECTKRNILSTVARLWDLMGYVAPAILLAKLFIKWLWENKIDWDDTPPPSFIVRWQQFENELPLLRDVHLPRHIGVKAHCFTSVLGFADASERGYDGVVYLHVYYPDDNRYVLNLLTAKSRVAPLRHISLARLELCSNLILARLMRIVIDTYSLTSGKENPADCLSRGLTPSQLLSHPLWFPGPRFARSSPAEWSISQFDPSTITDLPESKTTTFINTAVKPDPPLLYTLALRISSWSKLNRIVIYVFRFIKILPRKFEISHLDVAELAVIRALQIVYFSD